MKKTLAAVAILGAFAASASADVTLYGRADLGVNYNFDSKVVQLKSGQSSGSRWGLMGSEKISENLTVGFQLENGFNTDNGKIGQNGGIFSREARLYVATEYGTLHMGRMGTLSSGAGTVSIADNLTVFGTGYGAFSGDMTFILDTDTRRDNVVTYQSPKFGGATFYAQAASDEADGWDHGSTRYYAAAVEYKAGAFSAGAVASLTDGAVVSATDAIYGWDDDDDDETTAPVWGVTADAAGAEEGEHKMQIVAGVGYDFGVAKVKLTAAYTDYENAGEDSYGVLLGASAPVAGGTLDVQFGYADGYAAFGEDGDMTADVERMSAAAIYQYPLSKRTSLYVGAGWAKAEANGVKEDQEEVFAGMLHKF